MPLIETSQPETAHELRGSYLSVRERLGIGRPSPSFAIIKPQPEPEPIEEPAPVIEPPPEAEAAGDSEPDPAPAVYIAPRFESFGFCSYLMQEKYKPINPREFYPRLSFIIEEVAKHFSVSVTEIKSQRRSRYVVIPRQMCFYLAKEITIRSTPHIGRQMGGRDHTTVLHGCKAMTKRMSANPTLAADALAIKARIEEAMEGFRQEAKERERAAISNFARIKSAEAAE